MTVRKTRDIKNALENKGFELTKSHHLMYILQVNGRKTSIRTRISHGIKEYSSPLLGAMSQQLKLNKEQLLELIDCPLSYEEYVKILYEKGYLVESK